MTDLLFFLTGVAVGALAMNHWWLMQEKKRHTTTIEKEIRKGLFP